VTATPARWRSVARVTFALVCAAWWLQKLGWAQPVGQWDFRVYYFGAQAWRAGLNPYDPAVLPPDLAGQGLRFSYPPYALALFAPFAVLSVVRATQLFIVLKVAALAWLVTLWSRRLRVRVSDPVWVLFLLFAYSSAVFVDAISGSITTFEQVLVWLGVAALLSGRPWRFTAAVVFASLFRMTPIALLAVCLAYGRRGFRYVASGVAALVAVLAITYVAAPTLTLGFVRSIQANVSGERGWLNPSAMQLAIDLSAAAGRALHTTAPAALSALVYLAIVVAITAPTVVTIHALRRSPESDYLEPAVYLAILAIALVLPRLKNYSYILLIVPTYYIATRSVRLRRAVPLLVVACLPVYSWIASPDHLALVADYSKWLIALGAWGLFVYELQDREQGTLRLA